jgi:hypothetical protein
MRKVKPALSSAKKAADSGATKRHPMNALRHLGAKHDLILLEVLDGASCVQRLWSLVSL